MMNKFILYLLLTCLSSSLLAKECTKQEAIESELTSAYIKTWQELESHFIKYAHCDDGAIAEGYSESVSTLMGTKWSEFLAYSMDEDFLNFVKNHVDQTWNIDRINEVTKLVKLNCNEDKREICNLILELKH